MMGIYYKKAHPDSWERELEIANRTYLSPRWLAGGIDAGHALIAQKRLQLPRAPSSPWPIAATPDSAESDATAFRLPRLSRNNQTLVQAPGQGKGLGRRTARFARRPLEVETKDLYDYKRFNQACLNQLRRRLPDC